MQDHGYYVLPDAAIHKPCQAMTITVEQCHGGPDRADSSDTESFYSAASTVKRRRHMTQSRRRRNPKVSEMSVTRTDWTTNLEPNDLKLHYTSPTVRSFSQASPNRSNRMSSRVSIPARQSSLAICNKNKTRRPDLVNLHKQSCQLFSSMDGMMALSRDFTPLPSTTTSRSTTRQASISTEEPPLFMFVPASGPTYGEKGECVTYSTFLSATASSVTDSYPSSSPTTGSLDSNIPPPRQHALNSIISWTSDETRRAEYAEIDRAYSGVRGFLKRTLPNCMQSRAKRRRNFYSTVGVNARGEEVADDGDSVRRFRVNLDDNDNDDDDNDDVFDESMDGASEKSPGKKSTERRKSWWMCFQS